MYVESSALLSVLLGEGRAPEVTAAMADADAFVTSSLTILEVRRTLIRLVTDGQITTDQASAKFSVLQQMRKAWWVLSIDGFVLDIAGEPFDLEPVRSLDALHLASAWFAQQHGMTPFVVLSLDRRVRLNAIAFGVDVAPLPTPEELAAVKQALVSLPFGES